MQKEADMLSYLHWKAALWAGLMAGAVFVILEMLLVGKHAGKHKA